MTQPTQDAVQVNLAILTNSVELASQIVLKVAGNDASNQIKGASITDAFVADAVAARLQAKLMTSTGA